MSSPVSTPSLRLPASSFSPGELCDYVFASVEKEVATSGKFSYPKFGTFSSKTRGARVYRNPKTGEAVHKSAAEYVSFRQSSAWKQNMN